MHKLRILWYLCAGLFQPKLRTRAHIDAWQRKQLRHVARTVLAKSPYYSHYVRDGNVDLSAIPVMTKDRYVEHFTTINTCGIDRDQAMAVALQAERSRDFGGTINGITVGMSTGTSGKRSLFLVSPRERALWAAHVVRHILLPRLRRPGRIAFFLRANSGLYESIGSLLYRFTFFDLMRPFTDLLPEVDRLQPHVLAAPPSILLRLAEECRKGAVQLRPRVVVSFAEVLHDDVRHRIADVFGVQPINIYQCTEGFIGMTCEYGTMHLQEDVMHIEQEWIDEQHYRPLITDLTRDAVPIVRYRMTDILEHRSAPCLCGSPMLAVERIVGRDDDVLLFCNAQGLETPIYPDVLSRVIAQRTDAYRAYAVRQTSWTDVTVQVDAADDVRSETERVMVQAVGDLLAANAIVNVAITIQAYTAPPPGVKQRRIQRCNTTTNRQHSA